MGGIGRVIELPWPPASLSGHNTGHWRSKSSIVAKHRQWAKLATLEAKINAEPMRFNADGDVELTITFIPPDRRGDRINFPNRMKPYFDGIADALSVNDSRFLPTFKFADPQPGGKVLVTL